MLKFEELWRMVLRGSSNDVADDLLLASQLSLRQRLVKDSGTLDEEISYG